MAPASSLIPAPAQSRLFMSGNDAVSRAVWEAGVRVAAAYPGTPSTEMLEVLSTYPDIYTEWSINEKVSLEVALGASMAGSRAFCAMKHVGLNVAADALMTLTLTGINGGLVIAVADDVGLSSSQNEQDSRNWGRFAHIPVFEPADSQEAYAMTLAAFELSERFQAPVLLRLTTRICHVKGLVVVGERQERPVSGFTKDAARWVMVPGNAGKRLPLMFEREKAMAQAAAESPLNVVEDGSDRRVGFVASGPAALHAGFRRSPRSAYASGRQSGGRRPESRASASQTGPTVHPDGFPWACRSGTGCGGFGGDAGRGRCGCRRF